LVPDVVPEQIIDETVTSVSEEIEQQTITEKLTEEQASDEDSSSSADEDDEEYKPDTETRGRRP
jgi:hypothetical protein